MNQDEQSQSQSQSQFRLSEPGEREIVTSKPGFPIIVVDGPPGFQPYVVQMSEWKGQIRVSIRQHYPPKANSKVLLPSKRGLDLTPELASVVAAAIARVILEYQDPEAVAVREMGAVVQEYEPDTEGEIPF